MRIFMSAISLAGFGGLGYLLWTLNLPGEEKRKELLKVIRFLQVPTSGLAEIYGVFFLLILQKLHVFHWRNEL